MTVMTAWRTCTCVAKVIGTIVWPGQRPSDWKQLIKRRKATRQLHV